MNEKPQKPSYVDNMQMARSQKQDSDASGAIIQSLGIMSTIMKNSIERSMELSDRVGELTKTIKTDREETTKLIRSVSGIGATPKEKIDHKKKEKDDTLEKEVKSINELLQEEINLRKEQFKKKGGGILSALAGLLAVGGLMGFLITGKQEFLFSVVKGIKHAGNLIKDFFTMPLKIAKASKEFIEVMSKGGKVVDAIGSGGKMFLGMKNFFTSFQKISTLGGAVNAIKSGDALAGVGKSIKNAIAFAKNLGSLMKGGSSIGKIFGSIGKLAKGGLGAMKAAGAGIKAFAKTGGKTALKKIPVIGSLMGLIFGIQRFSKGDIIGGVLEVASGLTSMIPGIGIPLGLAIDGFLLMNDFKGGSMTKKANENIKRVGKDVLRDTPVIGSIMRMQEAFKLWNEGKKKDAIIAFTKAGLVNIPILNAFVDNMDSIIGNGLDFASAKAKEAGGAIKKLDLQSMKNMPIIGTVVRMQEAMKLWNSGNKAEALKEFAAAGLVNIPGMGLLMSGLEYLTGAGGDANKTATASQTAQSSISATATSPQTAPASTTATATAVPVATGKPLAPAPVATPDKQAPMKLAKEDLDYLAQMMGIKYKENQPKTTVVQAGGRAVSARRS